MENKFWDTSIGDLNQMANEEAKAFDLQNLAADAVRETLAKIQGNEVPVMEEPVYEGVVEEETIGIDPNVNAQVIIAKYKVVFNQLMDQFEQEMYNNYVNSMPVPEMQEEAPTLVRSL